MSNSDVPIPKVRTSIINSDVPKPPPRSKNRRSKSAMQIPTDFNKIKLLLLGSVLLYAYLLN